MSHSLRRQVIRWIVVCAAILIAPLPLLIPEYAPPTHATEPYITTVAGGGSDRVPALQASLGSWTPSVALDGQGNIYVPVPRVGDPVACPTMTVLGSLPGQRLSHVQRIDPAGRLTIVAGNGLTTYEGDGGPALAAEFENLFGIASDPAGNLFVSGDNRIRRVDAVSGLVTTIAGNGVPGTSGDGGPASEATLIAGNLAFDRLGNLYAVGDNRVRRIDAVSGIITTVAGNGVEGYSGDGGPATEASLNRLRSVAVDADGNLLLGEMGLIAGEGPRIRYVSAATGIISTVAGNGIWAVSGDGGPATEASIKDPYGLAFDSHGNFFIAHSDGRIRRVDANTGIISSFLLPCFQPEGLAIDDQDNLFVTACARIHHLGTSTGLAIRIAGTGIGSFAGDGGPATGAVFAGPTAVAVDSAGNLYVSDAMGSSVRRVDATTGIIERVAGGGSGGDGSPATSAMVRYATGIAVDAAGNFYISETAGEIGCASGQRVRVVDAVTGIITTYAGNGIGGFAGDGGPATSASLYYPMGMAFDQAGNLHIADSANGRVRRVDATTGIITTVAGNGQPGSGGDGGPATAASLSVPYGLAFDADGNLFIAEPGAHRVRRVEASTGIISTVAGSGTSGFGGDGGPANMALLSRPLSVAVDPAGLLFIADRNNDRIRQVDLATGIITTLVGDEGPGFRGDTGPVSEARVAWPHALALDPSGNLFFADNQNNRVRRISTLPPGAGRVPCESWTLESPLTVGLQAGDLNLSWGNSCLRTDLDYAVYEGSLGDWSSHVPRLCSTGGSRSITLTPPAGDAYYLVVPRNLTHEGSYGLDGDDLERPASATACLPQEIAPPF